MSSKISSSMTFSVTSLNMISQICYSPIKSKFLNNDLTLNVKSMSLKRMWISMKFMIIHEAGLSNI